LLKRWISSTNSSVPCPFGAADLRRLEDLAQVRHAGEDRADLDEMQVGLIGQQPRDGGLAHPGRPPEDQRRQRPRRQHRAQRAFGRQHMGLPDHLGQRLRPQPVGQRAGAIVGRLGGVEEIGHAAQDLPAPPPD
jgi:hypothetical protein